MAAASKGTPNEGREEYGRRIFVLGPAYSLVLYTNAAMSLDEDTATYADLVQPTQANGYAPILMTGTWVVTGGICNYTHPSDPATNDGFGNPCWYPSGTWSAAVNGAALVYAGKLQAFMDLPAAFIAAAGKKLGVTISNLVAQ